jgi:hypothetical protein
MLEIVANAWKGLLAALKRCLFRVIARLCDNVINCALSLKRKVAAKDAE